MEPKFDAGNSITTSSAGWTFSGDTIKSFQEHVRSSVPLYEQGQELITDISDFFVSPGQNIYDLGCSLGALTRRLATRHSEKSVRCVGIDIEEDMIRQAQTLSDQCNISFEQGDILSNSLENTSFISSYYTIQFTPTRIRQEIINHIYNSLEWGGAFLLFEKVRAPDARFQDMMSQIYNEFKISQGFSSDEILSKSSSLKGVLEPFSSKANIMLAKRAGFKDIMTVFKFLNFEGFLAIK